MSKYIVGVIGTSQMMESRFPVQFVGEQNLRAISEASQALPLMFAGLSDVTDIGTLLSVVDGVLLTGARANVHPTFFNHDAHPKYEPYDTDRDIVALEVIRACVAMGIPLLGICRGIQEMNVAFGGTLHPEISQLPGRINHRAPRLEDGSIHPDPDIVFAERHEVRFIDGGVFANLFGTSLIRVNSLHGQGIEKPGDRVVVEGVAEDGTVEAIRIDGSSGFALGVQWHAEHDPKSNPISKILFEEFGNSMKSYKMKK